MAAAPKVIGGCADTSSVNLELDGCSVSDDLMAAMERGLAAVSAPPELTVVVAADLVAVVNRLERRQVKAPRAAGCSSTGEGLLRVHLGGRSARHC